MIPEVFSHPHKYREHEGSGPWEYVSEGYIGNGEHTVADYVYYIGPNQWHSGPVRE